MSHSADESFFEKKRAWSRRKDQVLDYYLKPYLPKIATQGRPVLLVDGFAGPGKFNDGSPGSPLIIRNAVIAASRTSKRLEAKCLFIERDASLCQQLSDLFRADDFVETRCGEFLEAIEQINVAAKTHSVFLYVDPFAVEGIEWNALETVFENVRHGNSVELLLNFNVNAFGRRGLAVMRRDVPEGGSGEGLDPAFDSPPSVKRLNDIVGGDWWQQILGSDADYSDRVAAITHRFVAQLRGSFAEVCTHEVRDAVDRRLPKYVLVFGSRHPSTRELMNDAMATSLETLASETEPRDPLLFEVRPTSIVPDSSQIPTVVLRHLTSQVSRRDLIYNVLGEIFGQFRSGQIKSVINQLVKEKRIGTTHRNARLNDSALVFPIENG